MMRFSKTSSIYSFVCEGSVFDLCFAMHYLVSFLVTRRESWLLCLSWLPGPGITLPP